MVLRDDASLAVAIDPLDGSSNIDTNISIGTIFSVLPARTTRSRLPARRRGASSRPASSSTARIRRWS